MKLDWEICSESICQSIPATKYCKSNNEIHPDLPREWLWLDWLPMKALIVFRSHMANTMNRVCRFIGIKEKMNEDDDDVLQSFVSRFTKATSLTVDYTNHMIQIVEELERTRSLIADLLWEKVSVVEIEQEMVKLKDVVNKHLDDLAAKEDMVRKHFTSIEIRVKVVDGGRWIIANVAPTVQSMIKSLGLYIFHLMKGVLVIMDYTRRRVVSHDSYGRMKEELDEARAEIALLRKDNADTIEKARRLEADNNTLVKTKEELDEARAEISRLCKDKADAIEKARQLEVDNNTWVKKNAEVDKEEEKPQVSPRSEEADIPYDRDSLGQRFVELNDFRDKAVVTAKNFQKEINRLKQEMVSWRNTYCVDN